MRTRWPDRPIAERFFEKVNKGENCWLWTATKDQKGYGKFWDGARQVSAHRWALENLAGKKIPEGLLACHKCDTPSCVNPDHIFIGTPMDNMRDKIEKGRERPRRKLTHCKWGHEYTLENTKNSKTKGRSCRRCEIERRRRLHRHLADCGLNARRTPRVRPFFSRVHD